MVLPAHHANPRITRTDTVVPTLIQFDEYEFHWKCRSKRDAESDIFRTHLNTGLSDQRDAIQASLLDSNHFNEHPKASWPLEKRYGYWEHVITNYTARSITKPSDRLPALEGLRKRQMDIAPDNYAWGLWTKYLSRGVKWRCDSKTDGESGLRERPIPPIAPSWSPLCLNMPIVFWSIFSDPEYKHKHNAKNVYEGKSISGGGGTNIEESLLQEHQSDNSGLGLELQGWQSCMSYPERKLFYPEYSVQIGATEALPHLSVKGQLIEVGWKIYDANDKDEIWKRPNTSEDPPDGEDENVLLEYALSYTNDKGAVEYSGKLGWDSKTDREICPRLTCLFCEERDPDQRESGIGGLMLIPIMLGGNEYKRVGFAYEVDARWFGGVEAVEFTII
ncbi:hypothetical protein P154DRAFT_600121 [Amniculicola lignicola CBS 123094]|uniref:Heterokaryon incompatibility domain-containing protein n=1 Tax=Amniculicola lignicola CBS 123094 TaxID=1392246 RepID=A0A6A5WFM6_9PLEO|nr:hypothetical protein P154DRAFT_600121 [Amniculicola lignicola CBS 123094]